MLLYSQAMKHLHTSTDDTKIKNKKQSEEQQHTANKNRNKHDNYQKTYLLKTHKHSTTHTINHKNVIQ